MYRRLATLLASAGLMGTFVAGEASAQQPPAQSSLDQLQEILVTAEKRVSTVQNTPISITAITGEDIQNRGLTDFTALAETIPGLSMKTSGPGQTEFELRGLTSSGGNSPTVGFYLDDTPLSAPANAQNGKVVIDPNLYDLSRVEVLRGPQGTLYGAGSMGGTIKVVTHAPDPKAFDLAGQAVFSDTNGGGFNYAENGMINLPIGDGSAALRIVGSWDHESGWIDRIVIAAPDFPLETNNNQTRGNVLTAPVAADHRGVNSENLAGARASLVWEPTDRLSITPSVFYQKITQGGLSDFDSNPGTPAFYQPFDIAEPFTDRFDLESLGVQYHFDVADLTSQSSYWTRDSEVRQDGSEELQQVLSAALQPFGCPSPLPFYTNQPCGLGPTTPTPLEDDRSRQITEELRLASTGDTRFKWIVGYFYQDFRSDFDLYITQPGAAPVFGTGQAFTQLQPTKIVQNAFFGEATWQIIPALNGTVGLRHYAFSSDVQTTVSGFLSSTGSDAVANSLSSERNQGFNPKFNLSYVANKDLLLYTTASKGFRPGGANQPVPISGSLGTQCEANLKQLFGSSSFIPAPNTFAPDNVWSYELGEKWRTSDARVTLNTAFYYSRWNSAQQFVGLPCGFNFSTNTGDANLYGGEVELTAILIPGIVFSINGDYTHAKFTASSVVPGVAAANGLTVQDVPEYTSSASLTYSHPVSAGLQFTARVDSSYTASRTQVTNALQTLPGYSLSNLRAGVDAGKWTASLFAGNVFDRVAWLSYAYQINVGIPTFQRVTTAPPRTVGVDFTYRLGK
jgi:iron complex outermembrane recepter protein